MEVIPDSDPDSESYDIIPPTPESDDFVIEIELDPDSGNDSDNSSVSSIGNYVIESESSEDEPLLHPELPLQNHSKDKELDQDKAAGWKKLDVDTEEGVAPIPFMGTSEQLHMTVDGRKPHDFFEALFDKNMWEELSQGTNEYAHKKLQKLGNDAVERIEHPEYQRKARINFWKPVTASEMKIFIAHLIVMGIMRKTTIEHYWSKTGVAQSPFFGKFMSRNRFTAILSNLHLVDDSTNPPYGQPGHDPLAKLRPFVKMCQENFKFVYRPKVNLSLDESCCPWKGRLRFKVYNPRKPARFHIKLFQVCEAETGYIVGFNIYTGKGSCLQDGVTLDPDCNTTTKTVMTLLQEADCLDKGHRVYFDNYYTSPELLEELLYRDSLGCGTVRGNRKGLPKAVCQAKLKSKETCFRRQFDWESEKPRPLLALKWCDKRDVFMLSTIHTAFEKWNGKFERTQEKDPIYKPNCIVDYIKHMGGVDLCDQLMNYYSFLRRSCKWWRKLFVHHLNMLILNAYILNSKFGEEKLEHSDYRESIAQWLMESTMRPGFVGAEIIAPFTPLVDKERLTGRHFPVKLLPNALGRIVALKCKVCSVNKGKNKATKRKSSCYKCCECNIVMCVDPCFRIYHTLESAGLR